MIDYVCIVACGKGTRLRPLTWHIPKVLVNIHNENIITKIINYWKKYTNNFVVVIDEEFNGLVDFYLQMLNVKYIIKNVKIDNQENSYTIKKSLNDYISKSILITWCDVLPDENIDFLKIKDNCIFVNNSPSYESRYIAKTNGNIIKKVSDYKDGNIIGIYYFDEYKGLLNNNDKEDLCDCILNTHDSFITYQLDNMIDIGDKKKLYSYLNKKGFATRYFNKITNLEDGDLLKESTCDYGDKIISNEVNFYKYIINNNINYPIPEIKEINKNSFVMEHLKTHSTLFDILKNESEKNKVTLLRKLFIQMDNKHREHSYIVEKEIFQRDINAETTRKILDRFSNCKSIFKYYNEIKYVNNTEILSLSEVLNITEGIINKYIQNTDKFEYTLTHGDLNLSNILIDQDKTKYTFIDPRGYFGKSKINGSKYYEICKVYFSLFGFDKFNKDNKYYFTINGNNINTNINSIVESLPLFNDLYSIEEYELILCLSITVWLGLPYYFKTNISKLIGSHYHSLYIATKYLKRIETLKKNKLIKVHELYQKLILSPHVNDLEILEKLKKEKIYELKPQPKTYRNVMVNKPWGCEFLATEYKNVSMWILHMKKGGSTSLHCHETKDTPFMLLQGHIKVKTLNGTIDVNVGDILSINKKAFHSSVSYDDSTVIMELEIKPNKCDLFRYKDNYNRQNKGYEGLSKMESKEDNMDKYFDFYKEYGSRTVVKEFDETIVTFRNQTIQELNKNDTYIILDGVMKLNSFYMAEGSILHGKDMINQNIMYDTDYFSYVQITKK